MMYAKEGVTKGYNCIVQQNAKNVIWHICRTGTMVIDYLVASLQKKWITVQVRAHKRSFLFQWQQGYTIIPHTNVVRTHVAWLLLHNPINPQSTTGHLQVKHYQYFPAVKLYTTAQSDSKSSPMQNDVRLYCEPLLIEIHGMPCLPQLLK
jgi:hypothetical protein